MASCHFPMKATMQQVATAAEVSIGTVSRVLNRDPSVSADLVARVQRSIADLGYRPLRKRRRSASADGLPGKTVGLLTLGLDRSLAQLPVVTSAIDGIRREIVSAGANLQLVDVPDPAQAPSWLGRVNYDAWLVKGAMQGNLLKSAHPDLAAVLANRPCVWFHGRPSEAPGSGVGVNDWETGVLAARVLHEKGHRQVAYLSPKRGHHLLRRRKHGFLAACEELDMQVDAISRNVQEWTFPLERPNSIAAMDHLVDELLAIRPAPTAVFVPADSIAVLLYRAFAQRGVRIPDDMSVISVNHEVGLIAALFPSLTTIDIRAEEIGREAVRLLARSFDSAASTPNQDVQVDPIIAEGESVKDLS